MLRDNDLLHKYITEHIGNTDFTGYTIQYPPFYSWKDKIGAHEILSGWKNLARRKPRHLGLYVHIPYCKKKCTYCRYYSLELHSEEELSTYINGVKKEIALYRAAFTAIPVHTLYFGGGSPSLLSIKQLNVFFGLIYKSFDLSECRQITFEGNPDFLGFEKVKLLKEYGVNRLTIGVQSLDEKVLKLSNRYQTATSFLVCFEAAKKAKIENINVDLMAGLPGQTISSFIKTLEAVISLGPQMIHIHPFYPTGLTHFVQEGNFFPEAEMSRRSDISDAGRRLMMKAGYRGIKFDAWGNNENARNIQLSDAIEYNGSFLGIGSAAASHATGYFRYINMNSVRDYLKSVGKGKLPILRAARVNKKDEMIFFCTASLRYGKINKSKFKAIFNLEVEDVFKEEIRYLRSRKIITSSNGDLCFNMKNIGEYQIFSKYFYSPKLLQDAQKDLGCNVEARRLTNKEIQFMLL